jgi:hypothetical protein
VREVAPDRPTISHLFVADLTHGVRERGRVLVGGVDVQQVAVARHRADDERVALDVHAVERVDTAHVDQHVWTGQPALHRGQEAVPAREQLRLLAGVLVEQVDRVRDARRLVVVELVGEHQASPPSSASLSGRSPPSAVAPLSTACHTRSGVIGISTWSTPNGSSASETAFAMACGAAMVPASPTPLTPSGLTGLGVTVDSVCISGTCSAFGTA